MDGIRTRAGALVFLLALGSILFPTAQTSQASRAAVLQQSVDHSNWVGPSRLGTFVHRMVEGRALCLEATVEQANSIRHRDSNLPLTVLTPGSGQSQPRSFRIILRGTSQLEGSPAAIEAFQRAAAQWEAVIQTDATITLDVDFGPTLFGKQFDDDVVAATDAQVLGGNSLYPAVRANLVSGPYSPEQKTLYDSLPTKTVPTDEGESTGLLASSATLRALGLIDSIARPADELNDFGAPPAIGLNSKFKFDFDSGDGVDSDKLDFEAMALHEIGHVLGFISFVGQQEIEPSLEVEPSLWDVFRLRPDAVNGGFASAQRILSSGGEQTFYAGASMLALSTGRPDGTGGDRRQSSHWKDDNLSGRILGVMDPTIGPGEHQSLTDDDVSVLDAIGYRTKSLIDPTMVIPLTSGLPQSGGILAPPPGLGVLSHTHYSIVVPPDATQLRIDLVGDQDVDLYARFGRTVFNSGHGVVADYGSTTDSNSETLTVSSSSAPALRPGMYYIAVANFGPADANFTLTATVTGGSLSRAPAIFNISARLEGDIVELNCAAVDPDGDFAAAEVTISDEAELPVRPMSSFVINSGGSTRAEARLAISGLSALPRARLARVVFIDRAGNRSAETTFNLGKGEPGGLAVTSGSFGGNKLILKVRGVTSSLELEINGQLVTRKIKVNGSGSKLTIKGNASQLNLKPGANRIRVRNGNGWSNILILNT